MEKKSKNRLMNLKRGCSALLFFMIFSLTGVSQNAGISPPGSEPPDASAGLDVNFTTKGLLIPRIALTGTANFAPLIGHVRGMIVYNTATVGDVAPGFYFNNGARWIALLPKTNVAGEMQYWDGNGWVAIPPGTPGQKLQINASGVPAWVQ